MAWEAPAAPPAAPAAAPARTCPYYDIRVLMPPLDAQAGAVQAPPPQAQAGTVQAAANPQEQERQAHLMGTSYEISINNFNTNTPPHTISFLLLGNIDNYKYLPIIIGQKRKMTQNRAQ